MDTAGLTPFQAKAYNLSKGVEMPPTEAEQVAQLTEDLAARDESIKALTAELEGSKGELSTLTTKSTELETAIEKYTITLNEAKDKYAKAQGQVQSLTEKVTVLESQDKVVGDAAEQIKQLTTERNGYKTKLESGLRSRIMAHKVPEAALKDRSMVELEAMELALGHAIPTGRGTGNPANLGLGGGGGSAGSNGGSSTIKEETEFIESYHRRKAAS